MRYEELLETAPFALAQEQKEKIYGQMMSRLTYFHREHCLEYERFLRAFGCGDTFSKIEDLPFLPVEIFKKRKLLSVPEEEIFKVMTSSGTTGQEVSKIFLDQKTAQNQQETLAKIIGAVVGEKRIPMLILDSAQVLKNRRMFSARGAGIMGFSIVSSRRQFAFDEKMRLDLEGTLRFLEKYKGKPIFVFGFTSIIWEHFVKVLRETSIKLPLEHGILVHGGGWKKMQSQAVSEEDYRRGIREVSGIENIYDYYGMAEQTGCIYLKCEYGHFHASAYSDVLMRRMKDFSICDIGEEGGIQVLSGAARSYPGHSILTQDCGVLLGIDDCPCGRKGKYFKITGRMKHSEIRGCSDTYGN